MGFWNKVLTFLGIKKKVSSISSTTTGAQAVTTPISIAPAVSTPSMDSSLVLGIDIYHGDVINDWSALKAAGIKYVFIKASQGTSVSDSAFLTNLHNAQAAGLLVGAYHYLTTTSGADQANFFLSKIKGLTLDLPCVADAEASGLTKQVILDFLNGVKLGSAKLPIIYGSPYYLQDLNFTADEIKDYKLWVAHYGVASPMIPKPWATYTFWQKSESANEPGSGNNLDLDQFNGTLDQLKTLV